MSNEGLQWHEAFLRRHRLPQTYLDSAQKWFAPLADDLAAHHCGVKRPLLIGFNGCQGSGKSTVCDYLANTLAHGHGLRVAVLSLDDFYLTRQQRVALADSVHPLLVTRGVPGTHDMPLLNQTLDGLLAAAGERRGVRIPRFDKARDERRPEAEWDCAVEGVDLVLLEGWCLGVGPQAANRLAVPVNELEKNEDPRGEWRSYVNDSLRQDFLPLYGRVNRWIMLRAPSFDCVYSWRMEQEQKLAASASSSACVMGSRQIQRFIRHYERLTIECLEQLPSKVDYLYRLDEQRRILSFEQPAEGGR